VRFLADAASVPFARAQLEDRGLAWEPPPADPADLTGQLAAVARHRPGTVVVDSYLLPPVVYDALRASYRVAAFVDAGVEGRPADVLVDPTLGAVAPVPGDPDHLFGIDAALVRDEVLRHRPADPGTHRDAVPPRVLVFSGGTDAHGAAPPLARAVLAAAPSVDVTVVAARPAVREELAALVPGPGRSLQVVDPTDRLPALVAAADVVVSAAGTSSAELLCLGAAAALCQVADNQADTYRRTVAAGLVAPLGTLAGLRDDPSAGTGVLADLLASPDARRTLRREAWRVVDGRGRARVADRL
jgi:spore coat polysaccharide biosynthesis predicted glycosyltransferase SpsG